MKNEGSNRTLKGQKQRNKRRRKIRKRRNKPTNKKKREHKTEQTEMKHYVKYPLQKSSKNL